MAVSPDETRLGPDAGRDTSVDTMDPSDAGDADVEDTGSDTGSDTGDAGDAGDAGDTGPAPDCLSDDECPPRAFASASCVAGSCEYECRSDHDDCDGDPENGCETELSTVTDCGGCGVVCEDAPSATVGCDMGLCALSCDDGFDDCNETYADGCEADLRTASTCGTCELACDAGEVCADASCLLDCPAGTTLCGDACVTTDTDASHCGGCDVVCSFANATAACSDATCGIAACDPNFDDCDGSLANGCETRIDTIIDCGSCGTACSLPNASALCSAGGCRVDECLPGYADCDAVPENGCETPTNTLTDCDACGVTCGADNATTSCATGTCELVACDPGYADCAGGISDGCEQDILSDAGNCGGCGVVCAAEASSTVACSAGSCEYACRSGAGDCNSDLGSGGDGCETDVTSDASNCGACGATCSLANASELCMASTCRVMTCDAGYGNCDSSEMNGCETDVTIDVANCGSCGNACPAEDNAAPSCGASACSLTCDSGFSDCNSNLGDDEDGCEVDTMTDPVNCGGCGMGCMFDNASAVCDLASCGLDSCDPGFCDIDVEEANGCEVELDAALSCTGRTLTRVNGDSNVGNGPFSVRAVASTTVVVPVREVRFGLNDLSVRFDLDVPAGVDYDLVAWCEGCEDDDEELRSSNGPGMPESILVKWADDSGDNSRAITARVIYIGGNACEPWELTYTGNRAGSRTCD